MRQTSNTPVENRVATARRSWLAAGLGLLSIGSALVAILGPLVVGVIEYHASPGAVNQIVGGDIAGLALVAPVSLLAAVLVWRGHVAGPLLALGPALYGLYMSSQLSLGGDISRYPGNSERFFPLYLAMFILAAAIAIASLASIDAHRLPITRPVVERVSGWFFVVVGAFLLVGLHLPGLIDAWSGTPISSEYLADPNVFWLVKFMDLGIVVPGLAVAAIGMLRRARWARVLGFAAASWGALLGSSVAGMAFSMQLSSDPAASMANTVVFSLFAFTALVVAWLMYRPLFQSHAEPGETADLEVETRPMSSASRR